MFDKVWLRCTTVGSLAFMLLATGCETTDKSKGDGESDGHEHDSGTGGEPSGNKLTCDVIIVGGGAAGLHTAFRLGPDMGKDVCLFEKEDRLGGRIYDVTKDGSDKGPFVGLGAKRIMETQDVVFALADELGIEYQKAAWRDDVMTARGQRASNSDEMNAAAFPKLADDPDLEVTYYDKLRERKNLDQYPEFRSYVRGTLGAEGYQFLTDVFRFRADFAYPLDARGYLDYFDEEWDVCCDASYPVGGMSAFIRGMEKKAKAAGVRIFTSEPAITIDAVKGSGYRVVTPSYVATGKRLVIAVDAEGVKRIGGDIAARIQGEEEFQQLIAVKVASIAQWWPSAWWEDAVPGKDVRRAWTTEHCINHIEIPVDDYGMDQKVTRSVYDDDLRCVQFWEQLAAKGDMNVIEEEIDRGLKHLFPDATIPKPDKTVVKIWPNAWYWLKAGSPFTNKDIAEWAVEPLPGEDIGLVGESYNPQRSGWSDGAYKSSINLLNEKYGMNLGVTAKKAALGSGEGDDAPVRKSRAQGGH